LIDEKRGKDLFNDNINQEPQSYPDSDQEYPFRSPVICTVFTGQAVL
jgi:hypothetical protein